MGRDKKGVSGHPDDNVGAADAGEPSQPGVVADGKDWRPIARGKDRRRNKSTAAIDAATILDCEELYTTREELVNLRENAADLRDAAANLRELATRSREAAAPREEEAHAKETIQAMSSEHMGRLQEANSQLVIATIEAQKLAEQVQTDKNKVDHLAHHDVLTGLPNRMLLQDRLSQAIELARRQGKQFAVMFMDLDKFKYINDSLGHAVGDQLLQSVARRLVDCVRQSDTVSRLGGDEFILLLSHIEHAEDAAHSAQKILTALALPHHINHYKLHISASIGISIYPDDGQDGKALMKSADTAMYYAKESGRDNYKFFEQSMNDRAMQQQSVEASLRHALEQNEFVLYYQPKIDLHSGAITGVEALIRWQHPEQGLLPAAQFISIAEDCGLILPIGRWVLREACTQAEAWIQADLPAITVAVNTSALEFRAKDFLDSIRGTLKDTCLEPRYLELELTESTLMRDVESANSVMHALADLGVQIAIDDFGTGYSSLRNLKRFPINTLKIDRSFVNQITSNPDDSRIVSTVISMGKNLKQRIIAEGVETLEQRAFLQAHHCDEGQGYYFGRPMIAEELTRLLQTGVSPAPLH